MSSTEQYTSVSKKCFLSRKEIKSCWVRAKIDMNEFLSAEGVEMIFLFVFIEKPSKYSHVPERGQDACKTKCVAKFNLFEWFSARNYFTLKFSEISALISAFKLLEFCSGIWLKLLKFTSICAHLRIYIWLSVSPDFRDLGDH